MSAAEQDIPRAPQVNAAELNIYQRINEVRKKVNYAKRDKSVQGQYKAVTHDQVTALVRNELIEHGIVIVPRLINSGTVDVGSTQKGTTIIRYAGMFEVDFVNCDKPEDKTTLPIEAHANDSGDKAPGKAVSYATKGAMLKMFNIETGEDDESRVEPYGGPVRLSEEQIAELNALIDAADADRDAFLKWIKADDLEGIAASSFGMCKTMLKTKIKRAEKDAE